MMKKLLFIAMCLLALASCKDNGNTRQTADLSSRIDSLNRVNVQKDNEINDMLETLNTIEDGFRAINEAQGRVTIERRGEGTDAAQRIRENMQFINETMTQNKELINKLRLRLRDSNTASEQLRKTLENLTAQLEEKESQIAALQEEVNNNNVTINDLRSRIVRVTQENVAQRATIDTQNQTIMDQDDQLHEAYLIIGKKAELKDAGVLKGGFLKKSKVDVNTLDKRMFKTIDVRSVKEIAINAKKPEVLSQMPADSYTIEQKGKSSVLRITNVERFWSITKYLIVQTD